MDNGKRRASVKSDQDHDERRTRNKRDIEASFTIQNKSNSTVSKTLSHEDYTVGWICALWLEVTAARAMLDEEHSLLPVSLSDNNVYTLGSISGHNVVIACLPAGVYGTTSATAAGLAMRTTFPNTVAMPLMVGIGGGVPSASHDIRLGDVVISTPTSDFPAVKQYDYGKMTSTGISDPKGTLNKPVAVLLNAVNKLRSQHELVGSQIPHFISEAIRRYGLPDYNYPGIEQDVLYSLRCSHEKPGPDCAGLCDMEKPLPRSLRPTTSPRIHYGTIASGNQVIKHQQTRDNLARQYGILCFEMEAAGLMDELRCLVIRGISDYCDAQKNKNFQRFAALAAAAYTKELLSVVPVRESIGKLGDTHRVIQDSQKRASLVQSLTFEGLQHSQHRKDVMKALNFEEATTRRATVQSAHSETCQWLLDKDEYLLWQDMKRHSDHHGLLWIKGKPGTGKSTIMKFCLDHLEKHKSPSSMVISFFFNARGQTLEKTVVGMYRSLLFQMLNQNPKLQAMLDDINLDLRANLTQVRYLEQLFKKVILNVGSCHLTCFVDALDECPEKEVRDMIRTFSEVARSATANGSILHICFSSRHYPHISIGFGLQLILENEEGHDADLRNYINAELRIDNTVQAQAIKDEIFEKSGRLFLWIILVVKILNQEDDRGRVHLMQRRLKDIPPELDALFHDILLRDQQNLSELALCLQWILHAKRQLRREEFYFALLSGDKDVEIGPWDNNIVSTHTMDKYILDCSKGLAELTRSDPPYVQFIHESVREFLLTPGALSELWSGSDALSGATSHERLMKCCQRQLNDAMPIRTLGEGPLEPAHSWPAANWRDLTQQSFPFLNYAVLNMLYHANAAEVNRKGSQTEFLHSFIREKLTLPSTALGSFASDMKVRWPLIPNQIVAEQWIKAHDALALNTTGRYLHNFFGYILAKEGCPGLLSIWILRESSLQYSKQLLEPFVVEGDFGAFQTIILALQYHGRVSAALNTRDLRVLHSVFLSLRLQAEINGLGSYSLTERNDRNGVEALLAVASGTHSIVQLNEALHFAAEGGCAEACELLLNSGADITACTAGRNTVLHSISNSHRLRRSNYAERVNCFRLLLSRGASVNVRNQYEETPLLDCIRWADQSVVMDLLHRGADVNIVDTRGILPLHEAVIHGRHTIVHLLLENGSMVDASNEQGRTALHMAADYGFLPILQLILEKNPQLDAKTKQGETALHIAARRGNDSIVMLLLKHNANTNVVNDEGDTPLHVAAAATVVGAASVVRILLKYNPDFELENAAGLTPLMLAVQAGSIGIVELFLDEIAGMELIVSEALPLAMQLGKVEIVEMLIDAGAQVLLQEPVYKQD